MKKFFTKKGWLTPYALACGYLHQTQLLDGVVYLRSNNPELNTYDVQKFFADGSVARVWETVEGIKDARKLYSDLCAGQPMRRDRKSFEPVTMPQTVYA
jgi:hypothetical protein